jgi:hypothetical protein
MVKNLSSLVQLDIDAKNAYAQAIKNIDVAAIRDQMVKYQDDHKRHISELSPEMSTGRNAAETFPGFQKDISSPDSLPCEV